MLLAPILDGYESRFPLTRECRRGHNLALWTLQDCSWPIPVPSLHNLVERALLTKPQKVMLVAAMRKLLRTLNAVVRGQIL